MDIKNIVIEAYKTVGTDLMLVSVLPAYEYDNGKRTDNISGYKYEVVLPHRAYEKLSVKILGDVRLDLQEDEAVFVSFTDLVLTLYWTPQGYRISASASDIKPVNPPKKAG